VLQRKAGPLESAPPCGSIRFCFIRSTLQALESYSRATLVAGPADKLLYIFAALESVLLRNETEPVVSSISERFAFLAPGSVDDRIATARLVRDVYRLRSRYVHHAMKVDDYDLVARFVQLSLDVFLALVRARHHYRDVSGTHDALERRKFS
jgi:hypothetical protein